MELYIPEPLTCFEFSDEEYEILNKAEGVINNFIEFLKKHNIETVNCVFQPPYEDDEYHAYTVEQIEDIRNRFETLIGAESVEFKKENNE